MSDAVMDNLNALLARASKRAQQIEGQYGGECMDRYLLTALLLVMDDMRQRSVVRPWQMTPVSIPVTKATLIVDYDTNDLPRQVMLWVDPVLNGPAPTIRIGNTASLNNQAGQGIAVATGVWNPLGVVDADTQLFAIAGGQGVVGANGTVVTCSP